VLPVRMGIATGEAELRVNDFVAVAGSDCG